MATSFSSILTNSFPEVACVQIISRNLQVCEILSACDLSQGHIFAGSILQEQTQSLNAVAVPASFTPHCFVSTEFYQVGRAETGREDIDSIFVHSS